MTKRRSLVMVPGVQKTRKPARLRFVWRQRGAVLRCHARVTRARGWEAAAGMSRPEHVLGETTTEHFFETKEKLTKLRGSTVPPTSPWSRNVSDEVNFTSKTAKTAERSASMQKVKFLSVCGSCAG